MSEATKTTPAVGTFCWNELGTTDAKAARAFYTGLMGWTTQEKDMGHMGTYTMFMQGETQVGGMYEMKGPQFQGVPSNWMSYVSVKDVDASAAHAERLGGKLCVPPSDIPDVGRFSIVTDPTGATFALFQSTAAC